jgi:plastocyanin
MLRKSLAAAVLLWMATPVSAGELTVRVVDSAGRPVADAVVTVRPAGAAARPAHGSGPYVVSQKNMQFHPFVSVVPVGADVSFPNYDSTKHHVYSFSPAKQFELKLFARDQSRSVHFDKAGVVALGCNIHDQMTAFIVVADSAWTAKTNSQGIVTFGDIPGAPAKLTVWHPYLRAPGNLIAKAIPAGDRAEMFKVALRPPPMPMATY